MARVGVRSPLDDFCVFQFSPLFSWATPGYGRSGKVHKSMTKMRRLTQEDRFGLR